MNKLTACLKCILLNHRRLSKSVYESLMKNREQHSHYYCFIVPWDAIMIVDTVKWLNSMQDSLGCMYKYQWTKTHPYFIFAGYLT